MMTSFDKKFMLIRICIIILISILIYISIPMCSVEYAVVVYSGSIGAFLILDTYLKSIMYGWSKKGRNKRSVIRARTEFANLSIKEKGRKLSDLRRKYPDEDISYADFDTEVFDYEIILLYVFSTDGWAIAEADLIDNSEGVHNKRKM